MDSEVASGESAVFWASFRVRIQCGGNVIVTNLHKCLDFSSVGKEVDFCELNSVSERHGTIFLRAGVGLRKFRTVDSRISKVCLSDLGRGQCSRQ